MAVDVTDETDDDAETATVEVDDVGVWVGRAGTRHGLRWDEIETITAAKIDLVESVGILVTLDHECGEVVELSSSATGFGTALERICTRFPEARRDWKEAIDALEVGAGDVLVWSRKR